MLVPLHIFRPSRDLFAYHSKVVYLLWALSLFMVHVCLCYAVVSVPCSLPITCLYLADLLALLCVVFSYVFVTVPYGVQNRVRNVIVSIADLCLPLYIKIHVRIQRGGGQGVRTPL